jgi:hypothetical protein
MYIIILIMWFGASLSIMPSVASAAKELKFWEQMIVATIIIVGAPFMLFVQGLELLLSCFLEEGWDDDDKFGY